MLEGAYTAIVTPFDGGRISWKRLEEQIEYQVTNGCGLVPCGTTGENPTMTEQEHMDVVRFVCDRVRGRAVVIAGAGSNCTETAVMLARHAAECGADAALSITPYYNKPSQDGLVAHFGAVASASPIPIVVYNVPGRTGCDILPATMARLVEAHPTIVAIKEATGNVARANQLLERVPKLEILSGEDGIVWPLIAAGAKGVISVVSNVVPRAMSDLVKYGLAGDFARARAQHQRLFPLCEAMFLDTNPGPVKAALRMLGLDNGELRLPLVPPSAEVQQRIRAELVRFGLSPA